MHVAAVAELARAACLLICLAVRALLLALAALSTAALEVAAGALLAEAQESVGHMITFSVMRR